MESLFSSRLFEFALAPVLVLTLTVWLVADFIRTRRAVRRGEPLRVWYLRNPVYPDDTAYSFLAFQREYPAIILFGFVGLILLFLIGGIMRVGFWPPQS